MTDERKQCSICPVSLVCMAGRLKIRWRCAECAKLLVEVIPPTAHDMNGILIVTKKETNRLIVCDVLDLPLPEQTTVLPRLCAKCYVRDRQHDDRGHWANG